MIPSKQKVSTGLFKVVLEKGINFKSESFSLKVLPLAKGTARFSVVVPKKIEKSAVGRNTIKRRVYRVIRPILSLAKPGSVCIFFIKRKISLESLPVLSCEVVVALEKTGVIPQNRL